MDVEQLALGGYSPLEGFMTKKELTSTLNSMRLPSGVIWPIPITLSVSTQEAAMLRKNKTVLLIDHSGDSFALLHLSELYHFDLHILAQKLYGTLDEKHPGVAQVLRLEPVFLAGAIDLLKRRTSETAAYEFTPHQMRRLFESTGWSSIIGFHTRNVIHRGHEYIQRKALSEIGADGLLVHPVVGKKKTGDFLAHYIMESYKIMQQKFYPKNQVVFGALPTYSRYAGPKEALFTALIRQNYGCTHFIVGRDHTGVGAFYHPEASHKIFNQFPDLLVKPLRYGKIFYSKKHESHVHEHDFHDTIPETAQLHISGTEARAMMEKGEPPPEWFMRPEISHMIITALKDGKQVFVSEQKTATVLWFTGLSGAGKTTIAKILEAQLQALGKKVIILDGDDVRARYHTNLGFSKKEIEENNRLIIKLARERLHTADIILIPVIAPLAELRAHARNILGARYFEIYIYASESVRLQRDPKGLYAQTKNGVTKDLIGHGGVSYEIPEHPDLQIRTDNQAPEESAKHVISFLTRNGQL
jgi:sulfate adenylyltransferase